MGSLPSEDFIDNHSFRHRAENWEKLRREEIRTDSTISMLMLLHMEFSSIYLRTIASPSKPLMIQQS